jgi:phospholipase/carboxylesterase
LSFPAEPGLHRLAFGDDRDGLLRVPAGYRADRPAPLVLMLHGAGGDARGGLAPFLPLADEAGLLLLAVDSRQQSWDVIRGGFGPDVAFVDRALAWTFARCAVDPGRLAAEGFSDGASYALSLAVTNGDLFTHVIAFSPGFLAPAGQEGHPRIYVSHGKGDRILPIDSCSRRLVPRLRRGGYDVLYREFDGPHTVPLEIAREALDWFTGD